MYNYFGEEDSVRCITCHEVDGFYVQDGTTFCRHCGTESQQHGHETVVDQESAIFHTERTEQKRIGGKRKKKSKKKRRHNSFKTAFTTFDAFGCILDRWIDEAQILGAKDTLRFITKQLWFNYMKASGVAFQDKNKQESLPSVPHYRDIQVSITDRRRLLQPGNITRRKNEKVRKQQKEAQRDLDESDATEDEAIHKKRNKQRRKFLKAKHQADMALEGDETKHEDESDDSDDETSQSNSSFSASSTTKSSFYNDDDSFGLSLSSFNSTLFNESQETNRNTDYTQDSDWETVVTSSGQSGSESDVSSITGGSKNYEDKNLNIHIHVLDRLQKPKNKWKNSVSDFGTPRLKTVFAIFCLGVMLNEDNWITVSDLLYWADCGSISYKTSLLCIPQDMKLNGRLDIHTFKAIGDRPPNSSRLREDIYKVGTYLNLDNVRFAQKHMVGTLRYSNQILEIIARFTRELSLPQSIVSSIRKKLNILVTEGFRCRFQRWEAFKLKERQRKIKGQVFEAPSLDIYCMAIIIFVLKFDFGLDDRTEIGLSSLAMTKNEHIELPSDANDVSKKYFVFSEWLALSKRRVFLAAKFCHHLHNRYTNSLLPEVERSTPSKARFIEEVADRAQEIKFHSEGCNLRNDQENRKNSDDPYSDYGTSTASEYSYANNGEESSKIASDLLKTSEFIRKEFPSGFGKSKHEQTEDLKGTTGVKRNTLDISTSDTPLHDFSTKQIEFNKCDRHGEDKIRSDDSKKIESLLEMYNTHVLCAIDLPFHAPKEDTMINNSADVKDFLLASLLHPQEVKKRSVSSEGNNYLTRSILSSTESRLPNANSKSETGSEQLFLGRKYWISQYYTHNPLSKTYDNWQTIIGKDNYPRAIAKDILRPEYDEYLMSCLPGNFSWTLHYFAATIGVSSGILYLYLVRLENYIKEVDPNFFGDIYKVDPDILSYSGDAVKEKIVKGQTFNKYVQERLC